MKFGGFQPRFVPSTAASRFVLIDDDRTERIPERLLRDRADTVRIAPPASRPQLLELFIAMPAPMKLMLAGITIGCIFAVVYAYRPLIG